MEKEKYSKFKTEKFKLVPFFLFVVSFIVVYANTGTRYDFGVLSLYYSVTVMSVYQIFLRKDQTQISLNKTFHIFYFLFFGFAPALQFKYETVFFGAGKIPINIFEKLGVMLVFSQLIYIVSYDFLVKHINSYFVKKKTITTNIHFSFKSYLILSLVSFLFVLVLIDFNWKILFQMPPVGWHKENTKMGLLGYSLLLILRSIPMISLLHYLISTNRKNWKRIIMLFTIFIVTVFPFSVPRGTVIIYFLPFVIILIPQIRRKNRYSICYFIGFLVLFPTLDFLRNKVKFGLNLFLSPHLDAFHNFSQLYKEKIITGGNQLLGSVLFFLPDFYWKNNNKIVGTGQMLAEKLNYSYTNISMPFLGEGYSNFGYFGIFFFLVIVIVLNSFFDSNYVKEKKNYFLRIIFFFLLGFEFYLLRGDLYSSVKKSVSFLLGLTISLLFLRFYNKFITSNKRF